MEADSGPACGARTAGLGGRDYREALLHALHHQWADVRMRVMIALGLRGEPETADALAECALRHAADIPVELTVNEVGARDSRASPTCDGKSAVGQLVIPGRVEKAATQRHSPPD
jgi:hypothetical protein